MFGIGGTELVLILLFAFIIFGPDKLPAIGRTIGRAMRQFKNAQDEMNKVIKTEVYDPLNDQDPLKNPFDSSNGAKRKSNSRTAAGQEETFAERKARMTAEKDAARAAKAQTDAAKAVPAKPSDADLVNNLYAAPSPVGNDVTETAQPASDAGKEGGEGA